MSEAGDIPNRSVEVEPAIETVRERIGEVLDPDRIHGLTVTRRDDDTVYCVVSVSTTADRVDGAPDHEFPVLDVRTVVVDFAQDAVNVSDNGLWVPHETEVVECLTRLLARSRTDLDGGTDEDAAPLLTSAVDDVDPSLLLDREVEVDDDVGGQAINQMERHGGIDPARSWGYGAGPPPEVTDVVRRLVDAGLDPSDHLSRLRWGKKEPMDRKPRRVEQLTGNYGIELQSRESGLVAIDVDYPEEFPEDALAALPDTFEVSSPHGDDSRRHVVFQCDEKDRIAEEVGAWAIQALAWGDLWIGDRYLVGPGSQLSEFGCDNGEHVRGEAGGCAACEDPERGFYRVVNDAPIASVDAEDILALVEASDVEGEPRNGRADPDPPGAEEDVDPTECVNCGAVHDDAEALKVLDVKGSTRRICRGGCGE